MCRRGLFLMRSTAVEIDIRRHTLEASTLDTQHRQARKAGIASFVGTTIEWYDFYAYSTAAALVLGKLFFPTTSPAVGVLASFASFWVGFLARPIGGIVFGHLGDKVGRKTSSRRPKNVSRSPRRTRSSRPPTNIATQ